MAYDDFVATYLPYAQQIARQTGQDPQTVLGIIAQETTFGTHIAGNNVFGISPAGRVAGYPNIEAAGQAYVNLMRQPLYANVPKLQGPQAQIEGLRAAGYNKVNPNYSVETIAKMQQMQNAYTDQSGPSVEDLLKLRQGASPEPTSAPSADEAIKLHPNIVQAPAGQTTTTAAGGQPATVNPPSTYAERAMANFVPGLGKLAAGAYEGAKEVIDPQAELLARGATWLADKFGINLGSQSAPNVAAADVADRQAYQQQYGDSAYASVGHALGTGGAILAETNPIGKFGASLATRFIQPSFVPGATFVPSATSGVSTSFAPYLSSAQRLGVNALTSGVEGAAGAALGSGSLDPTTLGIGALAGGAMPYISQGLQAATPVVNSFMRSAPIQRSFGAGGAGLGATMFGVPGAMVGYPAGEAAGALAPYASNLLMGGLRRTPPTLAGAMAGQIPEIVVTAKRPPEPVP